MTPAVFDYAFKNFRRYCKSYGYTPPSRKEFREAVPILVWGAPADDAETLSTHMFLSYHKIMQLPDENAAKLEALQAAGGGEEWHEIESQGQQPV